MLLPELHGSRAGRATSDVRPVIRHRRDPVPRVRLRRDRGLHQHVLQRARARAPVAAVSQEAVDTRLRRRNRTRVPAGDARRPVLSRQAVAAGGPPGPQHVRPDVGPISAAERVHVVRGGHSLQDPQPDTAVRAPARPVDPARVPGGRPRQPAQRVHVLGRVDRLRASRPPKPQLHGGIFGAGTRFHGVQVAGGVQAQTSAAVAIAAAAVGSQRHQSVGRSAAATPPIRVRVRLSRTERVHQRDAVVRRSPELSVGRGRGRPELPDQVAVVQGAPVVRPARGGRSPGRHRVRAARVDLLRPPRTRRLQALRRRARRRTGHRRQHPVLFLDRVLTTDLGRRHRRHRRPRNVRLEPAGTCRAEKSYRNLPRCVARIPRRR